MAAFTSSSPSTSQLSVGIAIVMHDKFTHQAREANKALKALHREAKLAVLANAQAGITIGDTLSQIGGIGPAMIGAWQDERAGFVQTMTLVKSITGSTEAQMKQLSETAKQVGYDTTFGMADIASGMKYLAMAGNDANQIMAMIDTSAKMAAATGMELAGKGGTADLLTNIMKTFNVDGKQAAVTFGDVLTKAVNSSNMSLTDLAQSIKYAAADMVNLNYSLPQTAALIGTLGNAGIQGSMAGTAISNAARYLNRAILRPGTNAGKALQKLGFSPSDFQDAQGNIIDLAEAFGKIRDRMRDLGYSSMQVAENFSQIMGIRGNRAAMAVVNHLDDYYHILKKINTESKGTVEKTNTDVMTSFYGVLDIMRNAFEVFRQSWIKAVEPILIPLYKTVSTIVELVAKILGHDVWGPVIAGATTFLLIATKITGIFVTWKSRWTMLMGDSQVSFKNLMMVMSMGWSKATADAAGYAAVIKSINRYQNQMGGTIGTRMMSPTATLMGGFKTRSGYYYDEKAQRFRDKKGRYVSSQTIANLPQSEFILGPGRPKPTLGRRLAGAGSSMIGRRGTRMFLGMGKFGLGSLKFLGVIAKGLSGILGFLGGPVGLIITGISALVSFLPRIITAIKDNSSKQEENTAQVKRGNELTEKEINLKLANSFEKYAEVMNRIDQTLRTMNTNPGTVTVYVDNKKAFEKMLREAKAQEVVNAS